jgi:hypothetical protein
MAARPPARASRRQSIVQGLEQLSVPPVLDVRNEQRGSVFVLLVVDAARVIAVRWIIKIEPPTDNVPW